MANRFDGAFLAVARMGSSYENHQRFTPLKRDGKPLWEFKEHDHRLYCYRKVEGNRVEIVLLNGWVKQKNDKTNKSENAAIATAKMLYEEYQKEAKK